MNEAETRAELIDPALKAAGWGVVEASRVRREVITLGRLQGAGVRAAQDIADYVLTYRNHKLAVIEAKRRDRGPRPGQEICRKTPDPLRLLHQRRRHLPGRHDDRCGAVRHPISHAGRTLEPRLRGAKMSGATASPPFRSRTRAATGRRATTRTLPSGACWRPSPRGRTASC